MLRLRAAVSHHNKGESRRPRVENTLDQGADVRVVIIDDASHDETHEVASELSRDHRVDYLRHSTNLGHHATNDHGLSRVEPDYVTLVSADDLVIPGALRRAPTLLDHHRNASFALAPRGFEARLRHFRTGGRRTLAGSNTAVPFHSQTAGSSSSTLGSCEYALGAHEAADEHLRELLIFAHDREPRIRSSALYDLSNVTLEGRLMARGVQEFTRRTHRFSRESATAAHFDFLGPRAARKWHSMGLSVPGNRTLLNGVKS